MANLVYMSRSRPIRVYTVKPLSRLGVGILKEERENKHWRICDLTDSREQMTTERM